MRVWEASAAPSTKLIFVFKNGTAHHINNVELGRFGRNSSNVWNYAGGQHLRQEPRQMIPHWLACDCEQSASEIDPLPRGGSSR